MPIKSIKQWKLFQLVRNNPKAAKETGISKEVAEESIRKTDYKKLKARKKQ